MYKMIIVDDEEAIREGLSRLIDWSEMGFEVEASFRDGKETIEYLKAQDADVVLTDIQMDDISGLEIAKFVYECKPYIKVVILSGFKEFNYAKKAIEYNVEHYLLKPTDLDELTKIFTDLRIKLDADRLEQTKSKLERERFNEMIPALKEQFFIDLYMGVLKDEKEIKKRLYLLGINMDVTNGPCRLIHVEIKDHEQFLQQSWIYGKEGFNGVIRNFFRGDNGDVSYYEVNRQDNKLMFIALLNRKNDMNEDLTVANDLEKKKKDLNEIFHLEVLFRIDKKYESLQELSKRELEFSNKNDLFISNIEEIQSEKLKLFVSEINQGNLSEVKMMLQGFMEGISGMKLELQQLYCSNIFAVIYGKFAALGINLREVTGERFDYRAVMLLSEFSQIQKWCENTITIIVKSISELNENSSNSIITKAREFVEKNYFKDISLDDLSEYVFLNPAYFSRLFKQCTGENFSDYLIHVRMKKSIELLKENRYRIYEICKKVGYKSSKYFIRLFKKYTGYTPKEYSRNILKVEDINEEN